jgi:hypothetical protein
MKVIEHKSFDELCRAGMKAGITVINETDVSYSFRIFENKQTKELHIYPKPITK